MPPEQKEWMLAHLDEIHRLARLVDSLTLLARADAGIPSFDRLPMALDELVREVAEDAAVLLQAAHVRMTVEACEAVTVCGDRHRLRQLLLSLVDNAVKYNLPGGTITLSLVGTGDEAIGACLQHRHPGARGDLREGVRLVCPRAGAAGGRGGGFGAWIGDLSNDRPGPWWNHPVRLWRPRWGDHGRGRLPRQAS